MAKTKTLEDLLKRRTRRTSLDVGEPGLQPIAAPVDTFAQPALRLPPNQKEKAGRWVSAMSQFNTGLADLGGKVLEEAQKERDIKSTEAITQAVDLAWVKQKDGTIVKVPVSPPDISATPGIQDIGDPVTQASALGAVEDHETATQNFPEQRRKALELMREKGLDVTLFPRQLRLFDALWAKKYANSAQDYLDENSAALKDPYSKLTVRQLIAEHVGRQLGDEDMDFEDIAALNPSMGAELRALANDRETKVKTAKSEAKLQEMQNLVISTSTHAIEAGIAAFRKNDSDAGTEYFIKAFEATVKMYDDEGDPLPGGGTRIRNVLSRIADAALLKSIKEKPEEWSRDEWDNAMDALEGAVNTALGRGRPEPALTAPQDAQGKGKWGATVEGVANFRLENYEAAITRISNNGDAKANLDSQGITPEEDTNEPEATEVSALRFQGYATLDEGSVSELESKTPDLVHTALDSSLSWIEGGNIQSFDSHMLDLYPDINQKIFKPEDLRPYAEKALKFLIDEKIISPALLKQMNPVRQAAFLSQITEALEKRVGELQSSKTATQRAIDNGENRRRNTETEARQKVLEERADAKYLKDEVVYADKVAKDALAENQAAHRISMFEHIAAAKAASNNLTEMKAYKDENGNTFMTLLDQKDANDKYLIPPGSKNRTDILAKWNEAHSVEIFLNDGARLIEQAFSRSRETSQTPPRGEAVGDAGLYAGLNRTGGAAWKAFTAYPAVENDLQEEWRVGGAALADELYNDPELRTALFAAGSTVERQALVVKAVQKYYEKQDELLDSLHEKGRKSQEESTASVDEIERQISDLPAATAKDNLDLGTLTQEALEGLGLNYVPSDLAFLTSPNRHELGVRQLMAQRGNPNAIDLTRIERLTEEEFKKLPGYDGDYGLEVGGGRTIGWSQVQNIQDHIRKEIGYDPLNVFEFDGDGGWQLQKSFTDTKRVVRDTSVFRAFPNLQAFMEANDGKLTPLYNALVASGQMPIDVSTGAPISENEFTIAQTRATYKSARLTASMEAANAIVGELAAVSQMPVLSRLPHHAGYALAGRLGVTGASALPTPAERAATALSAYTQQVGPKYMKVAPSAVEAFGEDIHAREEGKRGSLQTAWIWGTYIGVPATVGWVAAPFLPAAMTAATGVAATAAGGFSRIAVTRATPPVMRFLFGGATKATMAKTAAGAAALTGAGIGATKAALSGVEALTKEPGDERKSTEELLLRRQLEETQKRLIEFQKETKPTDEDKKPYDPWMRNR